MPSERVEVLSGSRTEPGELLEWMDGPCRYEEFLACLRDLDRVNLLSQGYRPTLAFLDRVASRGKYRGLRILDVGFGSGAMLYRLTKWAQARGVDVELTGIDLNPYAARVARERYGNNSILWCTGDALECTDRFDVILSSLLTHHLATDDVVRFLSWMEASATVGWFINDLERSARSARWFDIFARLLRLHRFVQHDGPVSFARSFIAEDWNRMMLEAGVPIEAARTMRSFPARLCVSRLK